MNKKYTFICILFCLVTIFSACRSQGKIEHIDKSSKQHSSRNITTIAPEATVIHKDKMNNLWFIDRDKGIYKYDGKKLILFSSKDGLNSTKIISVQEDNLGNLYFDTPDGVFKYDGKEFTTLPFAKGTTSQNIWKSNPEDLWFRIGWDKKGPFRFDGKNLYHLEFPKNKMEDDFYKKYPHASFNPYSIYSIYKDSKGNIWFGTSNLGIYIFDGTQISWMYEKHWIETPAGGNFGVRSIGEDQFGNYWINNANYKYSLLPNESNTGELQPANYTRQVGIKNSKDNNLYFYSMETDSHGDLLMFAQEDGLWRNNGKELTPFFIKDGNKNISPTSMYKDKQGVIWLDTDQSGIYKYIGDRFEKFRLGK